MRSLNLLRPIGILEREVDESDPDRSKLDFIRVKVAPRRLKNKNNKKGGTHHAGPAYVSKNPSHISGSCETHGNLGVVSTE